MPKCTHKGCEQEFDEASNSDTSCTYHVQGPIFHEGLKGWLCCNKRVVDFDEFMKIPGCAVGRHSTEPLSTPAKLQPQQAPAPTQKSKDGVEVHSNDATILPASRTSPPRIVSKPVSDIEPQPAVPEVPEEDDPSIPVAPGTVCKRRSCGVKYIDDATSRGEGSQAKCNHHPGAPIFHEGSKGWSCCSRKVLEFDEFLKIKGCRSGNHLFVGAANKDVTEQLVDCRQDWYQTPTHVIISYFAKKTDKVQSKVDFGRESLSVDLRMPEGKLFKKNFTLFQPIEVEASTVTYYGTKVEVSLKKANGLSWASLEPSNNITSFTSFGVQGGSSGGTVGGKEMYLAADVPVHVLKN